MQILHELLQKSNEIIAFSHLEIETLKQRILLSVYSLKATDKIQCIYLMLQDFCS